MHDLMDSDDESPYLWLSGRINDRGSSNILVQLIALVYSAVY